MKYHYQFVSEKTVRIELIAEDSRDHALIQWLSDHDQQHPKLREVFHRGLQSYSHNGSISTLTFMNFPRVALCSFLPIDYQASEKSLDQSA
jgi:hypothetical protein